MRNLGGEFVAWLILRGVARGVSRSGRAALLLAAVFGMVLIGANDAAARCKYQSLVRAPLSPPIGRHYAGAVSLPNTLWRWLLAAPAHAASGDDAAAVTLTWYGHGFFRMVTEKGTSIVMDPFHAEIGLPLPEVGAHAVTVGREHANHNNVLLPSGTPLILRGIDLEAGGWRRIERQVRDVTIFAVPVHQRIPWGDMVNGSAYLFEVGDLCVAHLGDIGSELNPSQLENFGVVDVAIIPIGGRYSADPLTARAILKQLNPKIAIPMHYWESEYNLSLFVKDFPRVNYLNSNTLTFSKASLPSDPTIIVMTH